jgi:hypothetical protein
MCARLDLSAQMFGLCSLAKKLFQALLIEADNHFLIHHDGGSHLAAVGAHQLKHRLLIGSYVSLLKRDSSLREVGLGRRARWSAGLSKENDFFGSHRNICTN